MLAAVIGDGAGMRCVTAETAQPMVGGISAEARLARPKPLVPVHPRPTVHSLPPPFTLTILHPNQLAFMLELKAYDSKALANTCACSQVGGLRGRNQLSALQ